MDITNEPKRNLLGAEQLSRPKKTLNPIGLTLIELLLVIGSIIIIAALTMPVGLNFYRLQVLDETTSDILGILRRAQNQATFQKNDSAFGVKFLSDSYILFQGSSYAERIQSGDEIIMLPLGIGISGIDEVVFEKLIGIPSFTGTLTITSDGSSQKLSVNAQGAIERE